MAAKMDSGSVSILFWGHSFIRRIQDFILDKDRGNFCLDPDRQSVFFKSRSGAKAIHAKLDFKVVDQVQAEVVFLDVGTNDLDAQRITPKDLAAEVFSAAKTILYMYPRVKRIIILEMLFRTPNGRYPCNNPQFTADAHQYNNRIKIIINEQPDRDNAPIKFWHHKGMVSDWMQYIEDGVHLTDDGMEKYYKSLRRATIRFSNEARKA